MKKKILSAFLGMCVFASIIAGCTKSVTKNAIIKVNGQVITQEMFDKKFDTVLSESPFNNNKNEIKDPKNRVIYLFLKDKIVNLLILKELVDQEAKKRNVKVSQGDIDKNINLITERLGGKERLEKQLKQNNISYNKFKESIKADLTTKKLVDSISSELEISEKEAKEYYEKNKETKFNLPEQVRARHILISASSSDIREKIENTEEGLKEGEINKKVDEEMQKAKKKAQKILAEVKANPKKFTELAKKYSEDPSSSIKGGDLGYFSKEEMVPNFSKAAFSITPGKISDLVKTDFGYHIINVVDRKKAGVTPFNEIKEEIVTYLKEMKKVELLNKMLEKSKNSAKIVFVKKDYDPKNIIDELKELSSKSKVPGPPKKEAKELKK